MAKKQVQSDKVIEIKCGGESYVDIEEMNQLQGKLKSITKEDFEKLKKSLIKYGIPFGFHAWKDGKKKIWTTDGTHRVLGLKALRTEGWLVPKIPVNFVHAKNKKEAAQMIAIANSKYAHMTEESMSDFAIDFGLSMDDFEFLDIPGLDLGNTEAEPGEVNNTSKELSWDDFKDFDHQCPKCGFEWDDSAADSKMKKNPKEE